MTESIFSRTGTDLKVGDATATIPGDESALSILYNNSFIDGGDYKEDGYVYVGEKPVRKWFKRVGDGVGTKVWFPVMEDVKSLQRRYDAVKAAYKKYQTDVAQPAFEALAKVKKAHVKVTHEFEGDYDPWWLYTSGKYGSPGISFDWVDAPDKPLNLEIGQRYYETEQRLMQLGGRVHKFRTVLLRAIADKLYEVKGEYGDLLKVSVLGSVYWYSHTQFVWELLAKDDDYKSVEF